MTPIDLGSITNSERYNITTHNAIAPEALATFSEDTYRFDKSAFPDAILLRSKKIHDDPISQHLLAVGRAGVGVDNVPVDKMTEHGVVVFNAPGANANAVAELVITGMLLAARNIVPAVDFVKGIDGVSDSTLKSTVEDGKKQFKGFELHGKTLGVIGLGAIGVRVANSANALGMKVLGFDPALSTQSMFNLGSHIDLVATVNDILRESDFVTIHVPLNEHTRGIIGSNLVQTTREIVLLNFARDGVVDEASLVTALDGGVVSTYVTDFPTNDLRARPDVISLPHIGASTKESELNCAMMVSRQVQNFLEYGNIENSVNFPNINLAPNPDACRIVVVHKNVPHVIQHLTNVISNNEVNIENMVNASRGDVAITLFDLNEVVALLPLIMDSDDVISVRQCSA